jgi:hypothetical protein
MNARKLAFGLFWSLLFTSPGWGQTSDVVRPPGKNSRSPTIGQTIAISPNQAGGRPAPAAPADTGVVGIVYMEDVKEDAAPVKQDDAKIRERRDAVRYLGTVDCARWPEAAARATAARRAPSTR